MICSYVSKFQSKQCCFADIKQYIAGKANKITTILYTLLISSLVLAQVNGSSALQLIGEWTRIRLSPLIKQLEDLVNSTGSSDDERR